VFGNAFLSHYKIYLVATSCAAVAAKACPGAGLRVNLQTGRFIRVEGAA
jgi:hypothetical protein